MSTKLKSLYDQITEAIKLGGNDFDRVMPLNKNTGVGVSGFNDSNGFTFAFYYPSLTFDPIYKYGRDYQPQPPLTFEQEAKLEALMVRMRDFVIDKYGKIPFKEYPVHGTSEGLEEMINLDKVLSDPVTAKTIQTPICQCLYQILTAVRVHNRGFKFQGRIGDFYGATVSLSKSLAFGDEVNISFIHGGSDWLSITGNNSHFTVKSVANNNQLDFEKVLINVRRITESVKLAYPELKLQGDYLPEGITPLLFKD